MASLPDFNALLMQGYNTGREMKRQEGERNALAGVVNGDQAALGQLATYNPQMAFQVKQQQDQRAAQMEERKAKLLAEGQKLVGQAALVVTQHPEAERAAAWDAQIDALVNQGWTGMAQYKGKYSPQALESVIAQGGLASEYGSQQRPQYMAPQPGAPLVNVRDPAALNTYNATVAGGSPQPNAAPTNFADFNGGMTVLKSMGPQGFLQWQQQHNVPVKVTSPEQLAALPPGTLVVSPDGRTGVKH